MCVCVCVLAKMVHYLEHPLNGIQFHGSARSVSFLHVLYDWLRATHLKTQQSAFTPVIKKTLCMCVSLFVYSLHVQKIINIQYTCFSFWEVKWWVVSASCCDFKTRL